MDTSATTAKIDAAILALQSAVEPVRKNKSVEVELKTGGGYKSGFATYATLYDAVREQLREQRISVTQLGGFVPGAGERLFIRLAHDGEWIMGDFPIKESRPGSQGFGGGISFARRWSILCALGLVIEDDLDERAGYKDQREPSKAKQRAPQGIAAALAAIRGATADADFIAAAQAARASFATEPAVEQTISGWLVNACGIVKSLDDLTTLRDLQGVVRGRGAELSEALRKAGARLEGGK